MKPRNNLTLLSELTLICQFINVIQDKTLENKQMKYMFSMFSFSVSFEELQFHFSLLLEPVSELNYLDDYDKIL